MANPLTFKYLLCELLLERIERDVELSLWVTEFCEVLGKELVQAGMHDDTHEDDIHKWIIDRLRKIGYTDETIYDDRQLGFPEF
jgi:hypothetical protein